MRRKKKRTPLSRLLRNKFRSRKERYIIPLTLVWLLPYFKRQAKYTILTTKCTTRFWKVSRKSVVIFYLKGKFFIVLTLLRLYVAQQLQTVTRKLFHIYIPVYPQIFFLNVILLTRCIIIFGTVFHQNLNACRFWQKSENRNYLAT